MAILGMRGPYRLTSAKIDEVMQRAQPGNYAIGYLKQDGRFWVRYVGRSDTNLKQTLKLQESDGSNWFKWCPARSGMDAYYRQCRNFHDFGGSEWRDNDSHPEPPPGTDWQCPVCSR